MESHPSPELQSSPNQLNPINGIGTTGGSMDAFEELIGHGQQKAKMVAVSGIELDA